MIINKGKVASKSEKPDILRSFFASRKFIDDSPRGMLRRHTQWGNEVGVWISA